MGFCTINTPLHEEQEGTEKKKVYNLSEKYSSVNYISLDRIQEFDLPCSVQ